MPIDPSNYHPVEMPMNDDHDNAATDREMLTKIDARMARTEAVAEEIMASVMNGSIFTGAGRVELKKSIQLILDSRVQLWDDEPLSLPLKKPEGPYADRKRKGRPCRRCGHAEEGHGHYRGGSECSLCLSCGRYRPPFI